MAGGQMRVAGFGCRAGVTREALAALLGIAEAEAGAVAALACPPHRADEPGLRALASARRLPLNAVPVAGVETPTRSARIAECYGTGSVAEAAALVAAGPGARITRTRIVASDGMATCAIAETQENHE